MKYSSKNMRRSEKVQIKEPKITTTTTTTTNLLTNAAKMKITKAMANAKLQINNKLNSTNNNNALENEQNLAVRRHLAQILENDSRTPILQYVTSPINENQHQTIDEKQQQEAIKSLAQSLVQQQVNCCIKETTTNASIDNERASVKVENPPLLPAPTKTLGTTTTSSVSHEKFVFHDAFNKRSYEPVSSKNPTIITASKESSPTTAAITTTQTSTATLMSSTSLPTSSSVFRSIPTAVVVENCSSTEGTTVTAKFEVSSNKDFQTQNNYRSDVVVETRNNNQPQQQSVKSDKELTQNLSDKCHNNTNASKKTSTTKNTNEESNSVVISNNNNNYILNSGKSVESSELPVPYRGQNYSVIIRNYNYQRQQLQQQQQHQQQEEQQQETEQQEENTRNIVYEQEQTRTAETFLQRYEQQQKNLQQQQEELNAKERKENHTRGDPNLNQTSFQEQQQQYLLNTYNSCIYDLSLHHHLQQQQQQQQQQHHQQQQVELHIQQQNLTPYGLHLQPLAQTLHFFDECKNTSSANNNNNNNHNSNNNSEETTTNTNMPGNITMYTNYPHDSHHHRHGHHLESSHAHASITHTPTSIDEVIQDTLKDECLEDHHDGGLSYCTLTAVPDLSGLRETYYQQQLAHEQHLVQQHHLQQQQQHHTQPLLQQHLLALNQQHGHHSHSHHDMHVNVSTATTGSTDDSPPPSALVHNNMGVDIGGNSEMVGLNNFTHISNLSNTQRDHYGNLTPDHTPNMYFSSSLSPGLHCR